MFDRLDKSMILTTILRYKLDRKYVHMSVLVMDLLILHHRSNLNTRRRKKFDCQWISYKWILHRLYEENVEYQIPSISTHSSKHCLSIDHSVLIVWWRRLTSNQWKYFHLSTSVDDERWDWNEEEEKNMSHHHLVVSALLEGNIAPNVSHVGISDEGKNDEK